MDYIEERVNRKRIEEEKMKQEEIITEYNKVRENIESRELLDSLIELPPALDFFIIREKQANEESDLDKITDYINWYKYFFKEKNTDSSFRKIKENYSAILYEKYDYKENKDIKQLNKLSESAVELVQNKEMVKKNPSLIDTIGYYKEKHVG